MPKRHTIEQGACISSIALEYGFAPETIWKEAANAALKDLRQDPNVLNPGDVLTIPDLRPKTESGATEQKHRFLRRGVPAKLRFRAMIDDQPIADEIYELHVQGQEVREGRTGADGWLEEPLPPGATQGILYLGEKRHSYRLDFGYVNPADEVSGAQARLRNLGFYSAALHGELDEATMDALNAFQAKAGLTETGQLDATTQAKLKELHGG